MGLNQNFFSLSQQQLEKINAYIADRAEQLSATDEDPPQVVRIEFSSTVMGRCIDVFFDGEIHGLSIECPWEDLIGEDQRKSMQIPEQE